MEQIDPDCVGKGFAIANYPSSQRTVVCEEYAAGQNDKSPCSSNRNNMVTDENINEVAGSDNSDRHPGGGNMSGLQL